MSNIVNVTKVGGDNNLFFVDMVSGEIISAEARLVLIQPHAIDRMVDDPTQALRHARENGVDVLVDSDNFVGADMLSDLHPVPDTI